jgi:prepilin-type processing-associated H-X9-DG protein
MVLAVQMHMQDREQRFPQKTTVWADINLTPKIMTCPTYGANKGNGYGYNTSISGKALGDQGMLEAHKIPVIMDSNKQDNLVSISALDIDARHTGKAMIGFADGHVALQLASSVSILPVPANTEEFMGGFGGGWQRFATAGGGYKVALPAGWTFNALAYQDSSGTDAYHSGFGKAGGRMHVIGNWAGYNCVYPTAFTTDPFYRVRIPMNPAAPGTPRAFDQFWQLAIPAFFFAGIGLANNDTPPAAYAQISILDDTGAKISTFKLTNAGATASYTFNGATVATKPNENESTYFYTSNRRYYKYEAATSNSYTSKFRHTLLVLANGGNLLCIFESPNAPGVGASGMATAASLGGDWTKPTWVEIEVSTLTDITIPSRGGIVIRTVQDNPSSGLIFGWE